MVKKTHSVAGEVGQCHQLLAKSVVDQEPSHHHIQIEEACAETHQISDHLEFFHYSLLITLIVPHRLSARGLGPMEPPDQRPDEADG